MKRRIWTREELQECFRINNKGELERLCLQTNQFGKKGEWSVVDCVDNCGGYCRVRHNDSKIAYHTIVYILYHGTIEDMEAVIDHVSGDKLDDGIENLRLTTQRENCQNRTAHRNGRLTGCCLDKRWNKWLARIKINGKSIHLGLFTTEQEAHNIYIKACELINKYIDNKQFRELLKN